MTWTGFVTCAGSIRRGIWAGSIRRGIWVATRLVDIKVPMLGKTLCHIL